MSAKVTVLGGVTYLTVDGSTCVVEGDLSIEGTLSPTPEWSGGDGRRGAGAVVSPFTPEQEERLREIAREEATIVTIAATHVQAQLAANLARQPFRVAESLLIEQLSVLDRYPERLK